ncbi:hypothetical protein BH10PLA1_BH10PLA1_03890 [soil metagenome]
MPPAAAKAHPLDSGGPESAFRWRVFVVVAVLITAGFFFTCYRFWVPANSGVDQNGYLFGGRRLAETGTMKFAPTDPATGQFDPHQFVGRMWVGADYTKPTERFYPKYPIGLPLIVAIVLKLGGEVWGPWLVFWINPVAMSAAVLGVFFLLRPICGSYLAIFGQLVFATSPVTMQLGVDANSHATAVCCVTWGMVGLFRWWKYGSPWVALIAGLLIGYATTIRYSEATLAAVIGLVVIFRLGKFWRAPLRDWIGGVLATVGWLIPVGGLLAYNLYSLGSITGYDPTNESKPGQAFTLDHFYDNWETMLRHLSMYGLFFLFPIGVVGLAFMFAWRRRVALVMAAWILPCMACYTFYYWAPDGATNNIGYLRFFLTIFPAIILCGMWAMDHLTRLMLRHTPTWTTRIAALAVAPLVTLLATAVHLESSVRELEAVHFNRLVLKVNTDEVLATVPKGSAIFFGDASIFHNLQFVGDYLLFDVNTYRDNYIRNMMKDLEPDDPQGLDPGRRDSLFKRLSEFDQKQLDDQQRQSVLACLAAGKRVFVLEGPVGGRRAKQPRPQVDTVRRLITNPATPGDTLYADVIERWRLLFAPATLKGDDKPKTGQPRRQQSLVKGVTYEQPWLIYEVSKHELPESPERQAMIDYQNEVKAKADEVAAQKAATEKAKQVADAKRRDDERAKQQALRESEQARQKSVQDKLNATFAALQKATNDREAADKQLEDLKAAQRNVQGAISKATTDRTAIEKLLADVKSRHEMEQQVVQKLAADRVAAEKSLAGLKQQQAQLTAELDSKQKELQTLKDAIHTMIDPATTTPSTQPASE